MNNRGVTSALYGVSSLALVLLLALYFISNDAVTRVLSLSLLVALLILAVLYLPFHFTSKEHKLRRRVENFTGLLQTGTLDHLKEEYRSLYNQYLALSEKQKRNFYSTLTRIRDTIEEGIRSAKRFELLLQQQSQGSLLEQQNCYEEMNELYRKIPRKEQEKYYSHLAQAKERLEQGL